MTSLRPDEVAEAAALVASEPNFARYGLGPESLARSFETGMARGEVLLALRERARVVGLAWLVPSGAFARSPYLRLIATARDTQGTGAGTTLLDAVEDTAWAFGDDLFLLVTATNDGARRFYARRGFLEIGTVHDYVVPGVAEVLMRKRRGAAPPSAGTATGTCPRPPSAVHRSRGRGCRRDRGSRGRP